MKAINKNIVKQNREKLEDVLPLKMPFSIALDPCNLCNFKCGFAQCRVHKSSFHSASNLCNYTYIRK